jgi:hypothetical protein
MSFFLCRLAIAHLIIDTACNAIIACSHITRRKGALKRCDAMRCHSIVMGLIVIVFCMLMQKVHGYMSRPVTQILISSGQE